MDDISGAELTLRTTPTAGMSGEHSPYYRRLLSAGYKGYLQGSIGGATLYGTIGLVIGGCLAAPLLLGVGAAYGITAGAALTLIPLGGAIGLLKGASTFGEIGSMAAINAESAELTERRRYLLDRYYALPADHAYDAEAEEIQKMLATQHETHAPKQMFHWKTVLLCAALGAVICGAFVAFAPAALVTELHLTTLFAALGTGAHGVPLVSAGMAIANALGAAAGALIGGVVGLDRYYVRKWFDTTENIVSDPTGNRVDMLTREHELSRLEASSPDRNSNMQAIKLEVRGPQKPGELVASSPDSRVENIQLDTRLVNTPDRVIH